MNKKLIFGIIAIIVFIVALAFLFFPHSPTNTKRSCGVALTEYNIRFLYDGRPLEGNYYWLDTVQNDGTIEKIENGDLHTSLVNDTYLNYNDGSLKIIKVDSELYTVENDIDININMNLRKKEINRQNVVEAIKPYYDGNISYYALTNIFVNSPFIIKNFTIDLKTGDILNSLDTHDNNLWLPCDY